MNEYGAIQRLKMPNNKITAKTTLNNWVSKNYYSLKPWQTIAFKQKLSRLLASLVIHLSIAGQTSQSKLAYFVS